MKLNEIFCKKILQDSIAAQTVQKYVKLPLPPCKFSTQLILLNENERMITTEIRAGKFAAERIKTKNDSSIFSQNASLI